MWRRIQSLFPLWKTRSFQSCITVDTKKDQQTICGVFEEQAHFLPLLQMIEQESHIALTQRDSDMRFGGTYFYYGHDTQRSIYLVEAQDLIFKIAWYLCRADAKFVLIFCPIGDTIFDGLQQYPVVPTPQYRHLQ